MDIETAPNLGWVWGKWEQNVIDFKEDWYILCYAYKWLNEKQVHTDSLPDFPLYKKDKTNDKALVTKLWQLMNEADIIVAHNGDAFDVPKIKTRFITHGLPPPSPIKTIDTWKIAKSTFRFDSNKLDDLGQYLGVGRKLSTGGFSLWRGCMDGDKKSWSVMKKYNAQDILLLEKIYLKLRPWSKNHPNLNVFDENLAACPVCRSSKIQKRGFSVSSVGKRQRFNCSNCGAWGHGKNIISKVTIKL